MAGKLKEPESMDECEYFSRRVIEDGNHRLTIWVPKGTTVMHINYVCGNCGHEGSITDEYALPYSFQCEKCGVKIKVAPLKGKARGAKKKRKKKTL